MHFLGQVLFNMDEDKQEFVLAGWQRRILIRALAAIEAREPIKGVGTHPLQEGRLERWQQCRKLVGHKAGERAHTRRIPGNIVIAEDRYFLSQRSLHQSIINHDKL